MPPRRSNARTYRQGHAAGRGLYQWLLDGNQLPALPIPADLLRLYSGEQVHADLVLDYGPVPGHRP